jgi:hypothetical protein
MDHDVDEARELLTLGYNMCRAAGNVRWMAATGVALAMVEQQVGNLVAARTLALEAVESLAAAPLIQMGAFIVATEVLLASGEAGVALAHAEQSVTLREQIGGFYADELWSDLVLAEARCAAGDVKGSRTAIVPALAKLDARAASLADTPYRESYLRTRVPVRLRALAASLGVVA